MKMTALVQHIVLAFVLTSMAAANQLLLCLFFSGSLSVKLNLSATVFFYLCWLIWRNPMPAGRLTLLTGNLMVILMGLFSGLHLSTLLVMFPAMIWLTRSLLRYSGLVAVSTDLALCLISTGAFYAVLAGDRGSVAALWCFLLLQALHTLIPSRKSLDKPAPTASSPDSFNQALQTAESALQHLLRKV